MTVGGAIDDPEFDVVVVGSLNVDLVVTTTRHPTPGETVAGSAFAEHAGGKGLNQAVAASRLGARVAMVGHTGDDEAGRRLRTLAADEGIDVAGISIAPSEPTGRALITVDEHGENSIVVVPGANACVPTDVALPRSRVLLTQLEIPLASVAAVCTRARAGGALTVLDPAPATALDDALVGASSIIVPNEHEVDVVGGIERLLSAGADRVVVTLGSAGVRCVDASDEFRHDAIDLAERGLAVVDTTGAGDAFRGTLAAQLAAGAEIGDAITWANAAGALATTRPGAVPSLPRRDEVAQLLAASGH